MTEWGWHSFLSLEHVSSLRWTFYSLVGKPKGAVIGADWFVFTAPLSCKFVLKSWHGLAVCQFSMSFWRSRWLWKDTPPNKEVTGTAKKWKVYIYIYLYFERECCVSLCKHSSIKLGVPKGIPWPVANGPIWNFTLAWMKRQNLVSFSRLNSNRWFTKAAANNTA